MRGDDPDPVAALERAGEPPEVIEAALQAAPDARDTAHEVLPANWPAVQLFMALQNQWHRAGLSGKRSGLMYNQIKHALEGRPDIAPLTDYPALFPRLQIMEAAAIRAMNA